MKISLLQFPSEIGSIQKNIALMKDMFTRAMNTDTPPDVLVLPEMWSTGYFPAPIKDYADIDGRETNEQLSQLAKLYHVNIVGGSVPVLHGDTVTNTCMIFNRSGEHITSYSKTHLFSYAKENKHFTAGEKLITFQLDNCKCGVLICYDIRFPELCRSLVLGGIDLLFLPAAWPLERSYHWNTLTRARAIENQIYVAAVNSCGESAIIDPWGNPLSTATPQSGKAEIISADIDLQKITEIRSTINVFNDRKPYLYRI